MSKIKIRSYDNEFKNNAVTLYLSGGRSYPKLGEEIGVAPSTLAGWVSSGKYHNNDSNRKISATELLEMKKLRKELAYVKMERDILKKAVAIFTKPTKAGDSNL